jgi:hypothetical protein
MRAGTTLVQRLLCTAPDVNDFVPETHLLRELVALYKNSMAIGATAFEPFFDGPDGCTRYFAGCVANLLRAARDRHNPDGPLVLKNPELTMLFPDLATLRPTARFVVVLRDPRDCVASMKVVAERATAAGRKMQMPEMADGAAGMAALYLRYYANTIVSPLARDTSRLLFIRYEDIVTDPVDALSKLSLWSGLDLRPDAIAAAEAGDDGSVFGASLYGKAISNEAIGNFETRLDAAEVAAIESATGPFMETFGYDPAAGG